MLKLACLPPHSASAQAIERLADLQKAPHIMLDDLCFRLAFSVSIWY